ncbi:metallopeptidase TldD-related protein [Hydrocoleum sp. CS-953]|uniref:metallopeptidase TldD-related protein n=1 Tax=Hydrocoleum sp. CS-953 TaxID=1671698 RepID=UPI00210F2E14|nr:metallopeptidase TldD-related protein [Hydrocoleum sp. CS-953]
MVGQRKYLIQNGLLTTRLHNRETAGKIGEAPIGNPRALNAIYPPIVRMTNNISQKVVYTFLSRGVGEK